MTRNAATTDDDDHQAVKAVGVDGSFFGVFGGKENGDDVVLNALRH